MSARHPGNTFPVHHPWEAVPAMTNDNLFPSLSWSAPFLWPIKARVWLAALFSDVHQGFDVDVDTQ